MGSNDFCNLDVRHVFKTYKYKNEYREECIIKDIIEDNIDGFEIKDDGKLYCNLKGAEYIAYRTNVVFEDIRNTLGFINAANMLTEEKIPLELDINLHHEDYEEYRYTLANNDFINGYLSDKIVGISTLGRQIDDIDAMLLSNRDRQTINGSIEAYNRKAKNGHEQSVCMRASHDYVDKKDPDIILRMIYNLDPDFVDIEEQYEKFSHIKCENIKKRFKKSTKKLEKVRKKYNKKN